MCIWAPLWSPGTCLVFFCVWNNTSGAKHFMNTIVALFWSQSFPTLLSFQVGYNLPVPSAQEQGRESVSISNFPTLLTSRICWKNCVTVPSFVFLPIEVWKTRQRLVFCVQPVLWIAQHHTVNFHMTTIFEMCTNISCMCLSVAEVLHHSVSAPVQLLTNTQAFGQQLHCRGD